MRSINTSFVALLPVAALLYVGVATLGSGALKDLALALFVGMAAGAYSSIFIATPLAVQLKSREKAITQQDARARARQRVTPTATPTSRRSPTTCRSWTRTAHLERRPRRTTKASRRPVPSRRRRAARRHPAPGASYPQSKRPTSEGGSARRAQPTRQPRSKRGR